jgi:hypothetical protein
MAAALAALNNYFNDTLGIVDPPARVALNNQGLQAFDDFLTLTEKDISEICTNIRKPGGMIPNPVHNAAAPVAGIPPMIPNPGIQFGFVFEKRLKMLQYYLLHLQRIQRPMGVAQATLARLTICYRLNEAETDEEEVDLPAKLVRIDKVRQVLEDIDNYLLRKLGASGLPLAYVVRETVALPADDLGYGMPSTTEEMIERGPHTGMYYEIDNKEVWQMIRHVTHGGPGWSWVQSHQRTTNGRQAYLAIKTHYLGESYSTRIRAAADSTIESAYYDGKSRSFTFERYCEVLKAAFTDIETTGEEVSETRKVRVLLQGIQDQRLSTAKTQVLATPALKATFESALNFIAQFLDDKKSHDTSNRGNQRNVSSVTCNSMGRGGPGRGHGRGAGRASSGRGRSQRLGRGNNKVEDKYYPYNEWIKLSPEQQQKVRDLKAERDKRRNVNQEDRNVKAKTESDTTEPAIESKNHNIGAMMSQRKPVNQEL